MSFLFLVQRQLHFFWCKKKETQLFIRTHGRLNFGARCFGTKVLCHCAAILLPRTARQERLGYHLRERHKYTSSFAGRICPMCRWWIAFDTFNPGWAVVGGKWRCCRGRYVVDYQQLQLRNGRGMCVEKQQKMRRKHTGKAIWDDSMNKT